MNPAVLGKKLQKARYFMESGNFAEALGLYATLVKQFPQGGGEYGRAAAHAGDFDLADRIWEKVRRHEPKNAELLSGLAGEYGKIGLHYQITRVILRSANIDPRNLDVQIKLAWLLARTNSVEEARPAVNKCLELDSRNEQPRYLSAHLDRRENKLGGRRTTISGTARLRLRACRTCVTPAIPNWRTFWIGPGRFDEAMAQLEEGKSFARQNFNLEAERKAFYERHERKSARRDRLPKNILETWGKYFPPSARGQRRRWLFFPAPPAAARHCWNRVLDAHPAVAACDESLVFKKIQPLIDVTSPVIPPQRLNVLRQLYLKSLTMVLGASAEGKIAVGQKPVAYDLAAGIFAGLSGTARAHRLA